VTTQEQTTPYSPDGRHWWDGQQWQRVAPEPRQRVVTPKLGLVAALAVLVLVAGAVWVIHRPAADPVPTKVTWLGGIMKICQSQARTDAGPPPQHAGSGSVAADQQAWAATMLDARTTCMRRLDPDGIYACDEPSLGVSGCWVVGEDRSKELWSYPND
jgi:hypothetical protein